MIKSVPFELFEKNQTIYFDILRLAELEKRMGVSINTIINKGDAGINFCLNGLMIGMKHHYHKPMPSMFADKIEQYLADGGTLNDIAIPIVKAIFASGIFGKEVDEEMDKRLSDYEEPEKNG